MIKAPKLVNARVLADNYPEAYDFPGEDALLRLDVGQCVHVRPDTRPSECLVIEVTEKDQENLVGKICNHLNMARVHGLAHGEFIQFKTENISHVEAPSRARVSRVRA